MKNIHLILVNKVAASLYHCSNTRDFFTTRQTPDDLLYEMYITSDEEIKEGDWALQFNDIGTEPKIVFKTDYQVPPECVVKKIVLTTDEYLINDDAQAIDDEFLEWICKNPSCEAVEVKPLLSNNGRALFGYKIIIPKEEPKYPIGGYAPGYYGCTCVTCKTEFMGDKRAYQCEPCATKIDNFFTSFPSKQETLEEVAEKYVKDFAPSVKSAREIGFIDGAKWQQERMYSEEEVLSFGKFCIDKIADFLDGKGDQTDGQEYSMEELFEQFKKK